MSANSEPAFLSCRATVEHDVVAPRDFGEVFDRLAAALGLQPGRMHLFRTLREYKGVEFVEHLQDPRAQSVGVWGRGDDETGGLIYLRDGADTGGDNTDRRIGLAVVGAALHSLRELLAALHHHFGLISANLAGHSAARYARTESGGVIVAGTCDDATEARVNWDAMRWRRARTKLVRLSPITVIGPSLWATLPPMPAFDPAPTVEDLPGAPGCKIITAWPTLCSPRDPDFLRGTRALRAWLWPYTIQNPADDPANDPP